MIASDQPTIFDEKIVVGLSSAEDGNMSFSSGYSKEVEANRSGFLDSLEIDSTQTSLLQVTYEDNIDFRRYRVLDEADQGAGIFSISEIASADAVVVFRPGHAVLLPIADCIGAVIYDPIQEVLMVSHLGRHSIEQNGAATSIEYMAEQFGSNPGQLIVWLSPSAGPENYPLDVFEGMGLADAAVSQMLSVGISRSNIEVSQIDTTTSLDYSSHSQYLAGERPDDSRFAIVAMMT